MAPTESQSLPMDEVAERLESIARSFRRTQTAFSPDTPRAQLALEIAVLSERLDRARNLHRDHLREILRAQCRIGTDLMALDSYLPRVPRYRAKSRDNLKNQLLTLERDRLRRLRDHESDVSALQDQLFKRLRQHAGLGGTE